MSALSDITTFARTGTATFVDSDGVLQTAATGVPRTAHHLWDGSAWVNAGLFLESEARTQLLHTTNALVTQSTTVTAVPHTLHFTGTGTITLSGASTAGPLVGTGTGENNRVSLTFTPSAASLTLTVTGTVTNAQLEIGQTPSSYIPNTAGSGTVTRNAETLTIAAADAPWPEPVVIGSELVTNGTFDTNVDGWTGSNGTLSWSSGSGTITSTGVGTTDVRMISSGFPTEVGKVYTVNCDLLSATNLVSGVSLAVGNGPGFSTITSQSSNLATTFAFEFQFVATATTTYVYTIAGLGTDGTVTIDNVSVQEINPLAVSIQMEGTVTYADKGAFGTAQFFLWQADANNFILAGLDTDGSATGDVVFRQRENGTDDLLSTADNFYSPGINVPFNIASRHGTTFINGAADGTALTANLTPTALPDLSATDFQVGSNFMGTIKLFRIWADDIGNVGIASASN